jgi:SulP family sulfate permease
MRILNLLRTDSTPPSSVQRFADLLRALFAAAVLGAMAVTFALSLAAMIYTGPLAPYLSQGIGLALIGASIMAVVGPLTLSYRGTLIQPQDVSTILLSISAGAIATQPAISADAAFSTVVALVGVTSIATGLTAYAMGMLKLGYLVRFVPFPVVSGFLALPNCRRCGPYGCHGWRCRWSSSPSPGCRAMALPSRCFCC